MLVQAHATAADVVVGTDEGHVVLYDARTGQEAWAMEAHSDVAALAAVPGPDIRSVVLGMADGSLSLLDLRRQASAAELARMRGRSPVTSVATDGCSAVAGLRSGKVCVWTLDPACEQTEADRTRGAACSGAGLVFAEPLAGGGMGEVAAVAVGHALEAGWYLAAGRKGGALDICGLGDM